MKEALRIMKEQGKGWVKITKEGAVWTDGRILVLDTNGFDLPEGEYSYQVESRTFIPGKMPDYEAVLPKENENDYLEVEPVHEHNCLKLLKREYKKEYIVSLAGNGIEKHIRYLFFQCLLNLPSSLGGINHWKATQGKYDPVLYFQEQTLKAVVMPIDMRE